MKPFLVDYRARPLNEFDHALVRNYVLRVRRGAKSEYTARAKINALHRFWVWAAERYKVDNAMSGIRHPKMPEPKPKAITTDDLLLMFKATYLSTSRASRRDRALLHQSIQPSSLVHPFTFAEHGFPPLPSLLRAYPRFTLWTMCPHELWLT
jgi:site-specific recombinase XerD